MNSGYKRNKYTYNSGRYKPSSYNKRRKMKQLRNRTLIVSGGVVILALLIFLISLPFRSCSSNNTKATLSTETVASTETQATTAPQTTKNTQETVKKTEKKKKYSFVIPDIKDNGAKGVEKYGLYIWNGKAFDDFQGDSKSADNYVNTINQGKKKLGNNINLYNMIVPTSIEMGLPERLRNNNGINTVSQSAYIKNIYEKSDNSILGINCYNQLANYCNENIYFKTDYRMTALGGYYAYKSFVQEKNLPAVQLTSLEKKTINGFKGSYQNGYEGLGLGKEPIEYWDTKGLYDVNVDIMSGDNVVEAYSCFYTEEVESQDKFIVFLQGSYPMEVIRSSSEKAKDKICIIHESFSNPMISYFTYNYKEVYSINLNLYDGSIKDLCQEKGIKDVLIATDVKSASDEGTVEKLKGLLK